MLRLKSSILGSSDEKSVELRGATTFSILDLRFAVSKQNSTAICNLILARGDPGSFRGYKFKSGGDHGGHAMSAF